MAGILADHCHTEQVLCWRSITFLDISVDAVEELLTLTLLYVKLKLHAAAILSLDGQTERFFKFFEI